MFIQPERLMGGHMQPFSSIMRIAEKRKGGAAKLKSILPKVPPRQYIAKQSDDRFLSMMTRCINEAGFNWSVIAKKWPEFEAAYFGFNIKKLSFLSDEQWEAYIKDTRIVRNWPKIKATKDNLLFIMDVAREHGGFGQFLAGWPQDDQVGLMLYLKKHGSRLGGNTGQRFLRNMGWDAFNLSDDVVIALQNAGADIQDNPTSKKDLGIIQRAFNQWHKECGLSYTHLSKIAAYSAGKNYEIEQIKEYMTLA